MHDTSHRESILGPVESRYEPVISVNERITEPTMAQSRLEICIYASFSLRIRPKAKGRGVGLEGRRFVRLAE
jgi:hypothetical protein